ncbi:Type IV prepilin peptidase TadV/CpaA [Rubellimicrobium mesophilum DSM 19309]|uniref:Type IV prepilin peptidase TadV/CpaA n=1 Tax=Rubellimicrobium mesophilum DSM 19309 TaxID=442562 RepID=A0A017HRC9_9RHOB|nr:prepilin peptidase [Rubellimicrobium mesophilum]EYD76718.1 Type IV prepilin peptidase TadV/CpaA [Rubellimicrobium mesophilum DSM 19309]
MELLPLALAAPILLWIAWTDFRVMRIRNSAVLAALAVFVLTIPAIGWPEAGFRLMAGVIVFAAGFALFAARMVGGGDVKMGAALMLFVPTGTYTLFAFVFSAAMLLGMAVVLTLRAVPALRRTGTVSLRAKGTFPMGIALGLSGVAHLGVLAALS